MVMPLYKYSKRYQKHPIKFNTHLIFKYHRVKNNNKITWKVKNTRENILTYYTLRLSRNTEVKNISGEH